MQLNNNKTHALKTSQFLAKSKEELEENKLYFYSERTSKTTQDQNNLAGMMR